MDEYDIPQPVRPPVRPGPSSPPPVWPGYADGSGVGAPGYGYPDQYGPQYGAPSRSPAWPPDTRPAPPSQPPGRHSSGGGVGAGGRVPSASRTRTALSGILATVGCLAGSLAVAAFVLATIALNPDRPGAVIKAALSTPAGRGMVTDAVASALRSYDPSLTSQQASTDAAAIVASPGLASSLGHSTGDVSGALLAALKQSDPAAAAAISAHLPVAGASPNTLSALPTSVVNAADRAHSALRTAQLYLLILAVAAIAAALLIGPRRGRLLVRVGCWALGASVIQLVIWLALPKALGHFTNSWAQVGAAALRADGAGLVGVFVTLALFGAVCVVVGIATRSVVRLAR
jgi:hypothetical protein